jgi:hypothetical protein
MADINLETERLADAMAEVSRQMAEYGQVTKDTQAKAFDASMKLKFGFDNASAAVNKSGQAVGHLAKAAAEAGKSMYNNQKGASAFNSSLESAGTAVQVFGAALMLLGGPITMLVGGLAILTGGVIKFGKTINDQSDALYKGFQDLSRSGGAASDGMTGLFSDIQKLGLGFQDLEGFTRLIGESSRDLANFGGSVFKGRQEFAKIGQVMEPFRQGLFNAGMTQEQVNEGTMAYLSLQTRLGRSQSLTTNQLADGANKYLVEMDALTKLTGANRKDIEDQRKEAMLEEQFRAKLRQLELSGRKEDADRLRKYNDLMTAINPALGKGIRALSTGNIAADEAQRLFLTSSGQAAVDLEKVMAGTLPMGEAADRTTAAIGQFSDGIGVNVAMLKANDQSFMSFADQQDIRIAREKGFSETLDKINKDAIRQGVTGKTAADKAQQEQTEMRLNQQKSMLALQRLVNIGVAPTTTAMSYFAKVVANVSLGLEKFMNRFGLGPDRELTEAEVKANAELKKHQDEIMALERKRLQAKTDADKKLVDVEIKAARQRATAASQVVKETKKKAEADYDAGKAGGATQGAAQEAAAAGAPSGATTMSQSGLAEAGLKLRPSGGDIQKDNAVISPKLIELAKKIQESIPDFGYFSGFNDKYHHTLDYASKHTDGMALDFALNNRPGKEQGEEIVGDIKSMGASKVLDEYNNPSSKSTGGHIHVEIPKFADGGIVTQPTVAMIGEGGGPEAVIPLKNGAVPVDLDIQNKKQPAPVSLDMKNAMQPGGVGPTLGGANEYTGFNMGPMTTDLAAVKDIAAKLGAYDAATKMITDPNMWKQILGSGIAMNYDLGMTEIGTKMIPGIGAEIGERIQELKSTGGTDTASAIERVAKEFKTAILDAVNQMNVTKGDPAAGEQLALLSALVREQQNGNDIQKKLLQAQAN